MVIQEIMVLLIVAGAVFRVIWSVYRAVTVRDKSICGGCASCELKHELKKKGNLRYVSSRADVKTVSSDTGR